MDNQPYKQADPRPKRRKLSDNPYTLFSVGADTSTPHYYVSFVDSCDKKHCIEITNKIFDTFDQFELEDLSYLNAYDNHIEHSELTEASLHARAFEHFATVNECVSQCIQRSDLYTAIAKLPEVQRRRLIMYYFEGLTYMQIAQREGCKYPAVIKSVAKAVKKLRNLLE